MKYIRAVGIAADLTSMSFREAMRELNYNNIPHEWSDHTLVVGATNAFEAGKIAEKWPGLRVVILPDEIIEGDAWCLSVHPASAVYSMGA